MIKIISTIIVNDEDGNPRNRHCDIIITGNGNYYLLGRGGFPLIGDLQVILDAEESELLVVAITKNVVLSNAEVQHLLNVPVQIRQWLSDNPVVENMLKMTVPDREAEILSWDLTIAGGRQKLLQSVVALSNMVQLLLYREGFIE